MRPARAVSVASLAILLSLTTLAAATTANAATVNYAALGDSYSAGVGAGSYTSESGSCKRSTNAYPYLWKNAHGPSAFAFAACSGARTGDVLNNQLSVLNSGTTLVSITIGGNDAGFASTMQTCVLNSESACLTAVANAKAYATNTLPGQLDQVYSAIHGKAPNAHVVVLGYPHLYKIGGSCIFGIGDTKRSAINSAADVLDDVIAKRAANAGFTYEDVRGLFTGHEICASGTVWLNSTTLPVDESYHPKASGQSGGYLPAFTAGV
ncbi:SGNH family lipase [Kitasatospora atroaurantiaca]|uniref:GDSL-like lipase/acylhydrolase family protein n=1 Tax=Kitasatospora atroaurantiaca TaxID=285545 RepID=A0A561EYF7_9ACTN|nr:SGNH/GDSL hydrolase family protein [Kitasatospora atroaurantiaca]TWE20632.1 GDSL-like lipase/acylhydrolase family protein [Kitasatospora atroaurantiaca]